MQRVIVIGLACLFAIPSVATEIRLQEHTFTIPEGFEIQLVAAPPVVSRPITADFDEQGRLYVSESSGTNDKIQEQLAKKPHRILRLEDQDGDGVFEKSNVFADQMMFPEGTMWHDGSLYVAAPPSIWKLTDTNDDGVADQREEWFQGKTLTGCANDLHGPYLGLDGWVYWCKGAFAEQTYSIQGKDWKTKASHIFRCRLDGTGVEPVMTGGMDNPVDVVFLANGDRVLSNTFIVHPGQGQRDGLLHAIYGGVYGKEQGALDGHPRTGELMPILSHMGPAAACGLVRYNSTAFGTGYRDNLFCCQFNKRLISRHQLTPQGASYESQDSDFVLSDNTDFHPTDIVADADGSLLIVNTGGWYKLCCPSSQLHKPEVLGGIYRVRKKDAIQLNDPRGLKLSWSTLQSADLITLLESDSPAISDRAIAVLSNQIDALPGQAQELKQLAHEVQRAQNEVQAHLSRNTDPSSLEKSVRRMRGLLEVCLRIKPEYASETVRHFLNPQFQDSTSTCLALSAVSLWRDEAALSSVVRLLQEGSPVIRRFAAEALGRIGSKNAVPELLKAASHVQLSKTESNTSPGSMDRALEHSIIYALIEIGDPKTTAQGMSSENPNVQRAALIALDQMPNGGVGPEQVLVRLDSAEPLLRETANWLVSRHPEWGGALAGWFKQQLENVREGDSVGELETLLVRHAGHPAIRELLASSMQQSTYSVPSRRLSLRVLSGAKPAELPSNWGDALAHLISSADDGFAHAAVQTARDLPQGKKAHAALNAALEKFAADSQQDASARLNAMAAVHGGLPQVSADQFELLMDSLHADQSVERRSAAADALAKATLNAEQLATVANAVKMAGPLELDRLLAPFERSTEEQVGLQLLDSLRKASALSSLRIDSLQQKLAKYSPAVQTGIAEVIALVNVDAAEQKKQLEERLSSLKDGDVRRGQAVFNSAKAACTACHKFGYLGGSAGPDMTRIGGVRTERDLLESILFPSLSFVRSYEPVIVVTVEGKIVNGLIRNETSAELLLATGPNQEVRIPRADIEEIRPSTVSVMPAGLDKQLTTQELADLVAFLKNAK